MKNNDDIMKEKIRLRIEDDSWNFSIAHKVFERRESLNKMDFNLWSYASLATAAISLIIFMSGVYTTAFKYRTAGESGSIYSYAYIKDTNNLDNDIIAAKLELTINEAYPMR